MIDEWTISRLWEEIEALKVRVKELEDDKRITEEKQFRAAQDELDRQDGEWYRKAKDLG